MRQIEIRATVPVAETPQELVDMLTGGDIRRSHKIFAKMTDILTKEVAREIVEDHLAREQRLADTPATAVEAPRRR